MTARTTSRTPRPARASRAPASAPVTPAGTTPTAPAAAPATAPATPAATETGRGRVVVHAHFYQPWREDPFTGEVLREASAAPFHDWNARIDADCYRANAQRGNFARISFDVGPVLLEWLARHDVETAATIIGGDGAPGAANAIALPFHHTILPLASIADRRTEIRWGARAFEIRFGRRPAGMWLPEAAVDLPTLRLLAQEGIGHTILAPWQSADYHLDTRRPYRVELGGDLGLDVVFYDGGISGSVSFDPSTTSDADRFAQEIVAPRLGGTPFADGTPGLVLVATDGELYGHHQPFRDLFLQHLVAPEPPEPGRAFDITSLAAALADSPRPFPTATIRERTSWSCHHGVARWAWECPDAPDGRWKAPLRVALERAASSIDTISRDRLAPLGVDTWAARDAWVDVVLGASTPEAFVAQFLGEGGGPKASINGNGESASSELLALMEAQRWRLAMFASDAWFWDDPIRNETKQALRAAARAVRVVDEIAGSRIEARLRDDLTVLASPSSHLDGSRIYSLALEEIGQPG